MKASKAAQRSKEEFKQEMWIFDSAARSWAGKDGTFFLLERGESTSKATLLEKIMLRAAQVRLPDDNLALAHLSDIADAKNAMQILMSKERKLKIGKILQSIKKERLVNSVDKHLN